MSAVDAGQPGRVPHLVEVEVPGAGDVLPDASREQGAILEHDPALPADRLQVKVGEILAVVQDSA